jgi:hypothetical protein
MTVTVFHHRQFLVNDFEGEELSTTVFNDNVDKVASGRVDALNVASKAEFGGY